MILGIVVSLLAVSAFAFVLWRGRIVAVARGSLQVTMAGLSAMMDSELDDDAKEIAVRRAGLGLIVSAFSIFWRFALALGLAATPIFLADAAGLVSQDTVFSLMLRWDYILIVSVLAVIVSEAMRRMLGASAKPAAAINRYSAGDRFYHMLAFSSPKALKAASWIEDRFVSKAAEQPNAAPVFVTSLARGGTTALLNALHDIPGIATHIYRDMPFLTAPTLWSRLSGGAKRGVTRQKRAHGDGLEIDLDTPEAFEEVVWKLFWPEKFQGPTIGLWTEEDGDAKAERFLTAHMAKIIRARKVKPAVTSLYCSKNNANIARIPYLLQAFPGCRIVVPVRRPESHAASLLRQHENFLKLQAEDEFVRRYMRDIGHFEFGLIHKPIGFPGFDPGRYDPKTPDYWLHYWIQAFRHVLAYSDACIFVLQEDLRLSPEDAIKNLCGALDLDPGSNAFSRYFRAGPDTAPIDCYSHDLYQEAETLYRELAALAL
jgi:hypothetical protein